MKTEPLVTPVPGMVISQTISAMPVIGVVTEVLPMGIGYRLCGGGGRVRTVGKLAYFLDGSPSLPASDPRQVIGITEQEAEERGIGGDPAIKLLQAESGSDAKNSAGYTPPQDLPSYQKRVGAWVTGTFGRRSLRNPYERGMRVAEEAAEFAQAIGLAEEDFIKAVRDVYAREPGKPGQEAGGLMNVLAAACEGTGIDLWKETLGEMERVEDPAIIEKCAARMRRRPPAASRSEATSTSWKPIRQWNLEEGEQ